ncbi:MAG TPA: serine protein kinase RIO [Methanoregulaceae archaeon]|nr:serine protein kinase RIO [Methanoregulaceae archaeon]HOV68396.1 serine protein kinase RIO [Methanoregulaceae archaeon]HQJ88634.1 serine protein kinase RIO [Methanoregulaceae archaeon]
MGRGDEDRFDRQLEALGIRVRDADAFKVRDDVFDEVTLLALYRLIHKKRLSAIGGPISTGKEANVYRGEAGDRAVAVKIYRIQTANFNAMSVYLQGDRRFASVRRTRKEVIFTWTRKEFANLKRAHDAGLPVPEPLSFDRNILLMGFLGEDERPYPRLKEAEMVDPAATYARVVEFVRRLYREARLVHADLSEFNILLGDEVYVIDMGQSVTPDHPQALRFLMRDIRNVNRFFGERCPVRSEFEIFAETTGIPLEEVLAGERER